VSTVSNVGTIARREYLVRARSRAFLFATVLLVLGVVAISFAPAMIQRLGQANPTRIAVTSPDAGLAATVAAPLGSLLAAGASNPASTLVGSDFSIATGATTDEERARVVAGELDGVLEVNRDPAGELAFTLYTNDSSTGRTASLLRQAAGAVAIADRLARLGVAAGSQASIFAPVALSVEAADPSHVGAAKNDDALLSQSLLSFGMTILIFTMIIIYGTWIAQSVVEEKSSRVMEVVLNAATPFQLLSGKVLGVGAVALTQYGAVVVAGALALTAQAPVTSLILGGSAASPELQGLTPGLLVGFVVYGVLGFMLYATLFAAAGSLVSRSEDVNNAVMPLTLLCTAGYLAGTYGSTGLFDLGSAWMIVLSLVPFLGPFMMLSRIAIGVVEPWHLVVSITLLAVTVVAALWVAARIYAVGVLLYGSWPGWRGAWRLMRQGM
jgi:ABC-2 type transport system permease protein